MKVVKWVYSGTHPQQKFYKKLYDNSIKEVSRYDRPEDQLDTDLPTQNLDDSPLDRAKSTLGKYPKE